MGRLEQLSKRISIYQEKGKPIKNNRNTKNPEELAKSILKLPEEDFEELDKLLSKSLKPTITVVIGSSQPTDKQLKKSTEEREQRVKNHLIKEGVLKN